MRLENDIFNLVEEQFIARFRIPQNGILDIIEELQDHDDGTLANIPFNLQVLAAFNFFANGSYQLSVGDNNNINLSQPTVSRCICKISNLIETHMGPKCIKFPTTQHEIDEKKSGFLRFGMPNTIGIVDGTLIPHIAPPISNSEYHPRHFRTRKNFYGLNVEAVSK